MNKKTPLEVGLQLFSFGIFGFLLLSIFSIHMGQTSPQYIVPAILTLASAIAFRYVAVYHQFTKSTYRRVGLIPLTIAVVVSGAVAGKWLLDSVRVTEFHALVRNDPVQLTGSDFLPEWWIAVILLAAGLFVLIGAILTSDFSPYPRPTEIKEVATSPVYFGVLCAFFGLWAVLFVGISIQRVVVIAPIFEELLKFGIALVIGSVLFGRSPTARIGAAIVVGSLFGIIEHGTTYPAESDMVYLFRTLFHMVTTVLSVSVYTLFESREKNRLQWISPVFPIMIHFFYNTFVTLSGIIAVILFGSQLTVITLLYGGAAIVLATSLVVLSKVHQKTLIRLHTPFEQVLSDVV